MNHDTPYSLKGKTAVITGGGSGIGRSIAKCFSIAGAKVILIGRNEANLQEACQAVFGDAHYFVQNITVLHELPNLVRQIEVDHGEVAILVNNAGVHLKKSAKEVTDSEFENIMKTHVGAAFALSREFGKRMCERGSGHILFIASMASLFGIPMVSAYSAAKSAHLGLVRSLAADFSPEGGSMPLHQVGYILR